MTLDEITREGIDPALALLPNKMDTPKARAMLLAIGLQESRFQYRRQLGDGPARSFWQFERGGGAKGVLMHSQSRDDMERICALRNCPATSLSLWQRMEFDDVLAAAAARLLLWTDPYPLPNLKDPEGAWRLYFRVWRPGKPHRSTWDGFWTEATRFVINQGATP